MSQRAKSIPLDVEQESDNAEATSDVRTYTIKDAAILAERRSHIVDVATRVFSNKGYSNVSVNDIAAEAQVSIGSLYKYVKSKNEILEMIMEHVHAVFEECMLQDPPDDMSSEEELRWLVARILDAADRVKDGVRLLYREFPSLSREAQHAWHARHIRELQAIEHLIQRGIESGAFKCGNPRVAAITILLSVEAWCLERANLGGMTLTEYTSAQSALFVNMLAARL